MQAPNTRSIMVGMPVSDGSRFGTNPLGNNTKSSTPPSKLVTKRAERYAVQGIARMLYGKAGFKKGLRHPFEYHRTAKCRHVKISEPQVLKSTQYKKAFFTGLAICGSVWTCPICAAQIQERRRAEIAKAVDTAYGNKEQNLKAIMVTLTFSHKHYEKLDELLKAQGVALGKMRSGKPWQKIKKRVGFQGLIRSLELTFGKNGWHPHTHELWFINKNTNIKEFKKTVLRRWISACSRAGLLDTANFSQLKAFIKHAVDIKDNARCSEYLAKMDDSSHWGVDSEIAKSSTKKGRKSGVHPFNFLTQYKNGDEKAGNRWLEYSNAIKGKRQIFWSKGLKKWAGVDEMTDKDLAEKQENPSIFVDRFSNEEWSIVLKNEARELILQMAETEGQSAIREWLIKQLPPD